jgi:membrane associated rhomboid family serine protease
MGIYDRNYARDDFGGVGRTVQFRMPPMTPMVKLLLIINVAVFGVSLIPGIGDFIFSFFSVLPNTAWRWVEVWRLVSYQFLHSGIFHIFFNMLVLFFFGPMMERLWGSKRFIFFYLSCGAMGGVVYQLLVYTGFLMPEGGLDYVLPLVGASGAIYGLLAAGAILFPNLQVYVMGIFPLPFSVLAILMVIFSLFGLMGGPNAGGEAAHLAGMAVGAAYVLGGPWFKKTRTKVNQGNWEKKIRNERAFQQEVDRILDKLHSSGVKSLTRKEKKMLKEATRREQNQTS